MVAAQQPGTIQLAVQVRSGSRISDPSPPSTRPCTPKDPGLPERSLATPLKIGFDDDGGDDDDDGGGGGEEDEDGDDELLRLTCIWGSVIFKFLKCRMWVSSFVKLLQRRVVLEVSSLVVPFEALFWGICWLQWCSLNYS